MADRVTPPPRGGDSGERRPAPPRSPGGYSERPRPTRSSGYGEYSQPTRSSGYSEYSQPSRGYGERPPAPRAGGSYGGERRPAAPRSPGGSGERRPSSPRRTDVIRCENCGEDYSITYKRCPFCDERPGRGGIAGKRVANTRGGGYGRPVNPIQIAGLVISLALIASALFIVFRFIGAPIFGPKKPVGSNQGSQSSSQIGSQSSSKSNGSSSGGGPAVPAPAVQSITFNNSDFSIENGGTFQMEAGLLPVGAVGDVTWSSSDITVANVDSTGLITNTNTGSTDVKITVTAVCGDVSAQTSVICKGKTVGGGNTGPVASGTKGKIVNAEKGLNIRSGPGKQYEVIASAKNGASVTILGEENGFYQVKYSGDKTGYVSKDYVSVG